MRSCFRWLPRAAIHQAHIIVGMQRIRSRCTPPTLQLMLLTIVFSFRFYTNNLCVQSADRFWWQCKTWHKQRLMVGWNCSSARFSYFSSTYQVGGSGRKLNRWWLTGWRFLRSALPIDGAERETGPSFHEYFKSEPLGNRELCILHNGRRHTQHRHTQNAVRSPMAFGASSGTFESEITMWNEDIGYIMIKEIRMFTLLKGPFLAIFTAIVSNNVIFSRSKSFFPSFIAVIDGKTICLHSGKLMWEFYSHRSNYLGGLPYWH